MSVNSFGYTILDTNVKSLNSFGSIGAQGNIIINAFDNTQPDGKAVGNTGKNAFIAIGNNTTNNPLYIVGSDSQLVAGQPNKGKCSIIPNVGAANHQYDGHETMGIGYDSTTKDNPMPAGAWIRSAVDDAPFVGFNACLTLSNVDNTQSGGGIWYTHELTRVGEPNANDYNLFLNTSAGGVPSQNILNIHPTSGTATDLNMTATNINLDGIVKFKGGANQCGLVALTVATPSNTTFNVNGITTDAIVLLTQASGAPIPNLSYSVAIAGQLTISCAAVAAATNCAYFIVKPSL